MKVKCLFNTGKSLMGYSRKPFGVSEFTVYGGLEVGKEYLVMGMIMVDGYLDYIVDDAGIIMACPYQLFMVTDSRLSSNWHFREFAKESEGHPFNEAIWGYYELCCVDDHYEKLVEMEDSACLRYFERKVEIENELQ